MQKNQMEKEKMYLTSAEAARELHITRARIADLLRRGVLPHEVNPLDQRVKLIPASAIEELRQKYAGERGAGPKARRMNEEVMLQTA